MARGITKGLMGLQAREKAIKKAKKKQAAKFKRAKRWQALRIGIKKVVRKFKRRVA